MLQMLTLPSGGYKIKYQLSTEVDIIECFLQLKCIVVCPFRNQYRMKVDIWLCAWSVLEIYTERAIYKKIVCLQSDSAFISQSKLVHFIISIDTVKEKMPFKWLSFKEKSYCVLSNYKSFLDLIVTIMFLFQLYISILLEKVTAFTSSFSSGCRSSLISFL